MKILLSELSEDVHCMESDSCEHVLQIVDKESVDLILLDYHLSSEMTCLEALKEIQASFRTPIVILSSEEHPAVIRDILDEGVAGFITKTVTPEIMLSALSLIINGYGIYLPPLELQDASLAISCPGNHQNNPLFGLTRRQREVLLKATYGKPNKVISREMNLSIGTVKSHLSSAFRILGVNNRTEAVYLAIQHGLQEDDFKKH